MSRSRDLANLANNATGLETLTVSDITDLTATADELNYVDGVGSALQTQINAKAPIASPTFTGTSTFADLKATAIKHTNGTTGITINSDGSLSGKFEGAVKFKQVGKPTSGSPATGKVWVAYAIQHSLYSDAGGYGGFANTTVAILTSGGSWVYKDAVSSSNSAPTLSSTSADADQHITTNAYQQTLFSHTIEMDAV